MSLSRASRYYSRRLLRVILQRHDSPRQIAGGVALGTLVGFMPTIGGQMISAALLATLFRVSRIPAVVMVYITNPFTAIPIYGACYLLGVAILKPFGFEALALAEVKSFFVTPEEADWTFWQMIYYKLMMMFNLGWKGMAPLWLGCLLIGAIAAVIMYWVALRVVTGHRLLKAQRVMLRAQRRLERIRREQAQEAHGDHEHA